MGLIKKIQANVLAGKKLASILDSDKINSLAESDFLGAIQLLNDYSCDINDDYEQFLAQETNKLISFINDECHNPQLKSCLLANYYYLDAKIIFKSKYFSSIQPLKIFNAFPDLKNSILSSDYASLPERLATTLNELDQLAHKNLLKASQIDGLINKAMLLEALSNAKISNDKRLIKYSTAQIDFYNISTALKLRELGFNEVELSTQIVDGGEISIDILKNIFLLDGKNLENCFKDYEFFYIIKKMLSKQPAIDIFVIKELGLIFSSNAFSIMSVSPFVSSYFSYLLQISLIRLILVYLSLGKKSELLLILGELGV